MTVKEKEMSKWEMIKAARAEREAKEQEIEEKENEEEVEYEEEGDEELITEEEISSLDLIQAVIDNKPGNFTKLFEELMHARIAPMVNERKVEIANNLITDQEVIDPETETEEEDPDSDEEDDEEELDEGMPSNATKLKVVGKKAAAVTDADHVKNIKPQVHSTTQGNSEKHAHHLKTFSRLKPMGNPGKNVNTAGGIQHIKKITPEEEELAEDKGKKFIKKGHVKGKAGAKTDVDATDD